MPTDYRVSGELTLADFYDATTALAASRIIGIEIGELETRTGSESLAPLLDALGPVLDAICQS